MSFQDLPEELILKVLSYSEPEDLITSGHVSKRFRTISHDSSLWQRVNLSKKVVKTEFLEVILSKGCKSLNLSESTIINSFSIYQNHWPSFLLFAGARREHSIVSPLYQNSQLRELDLSGIEDVEASEEILASCNFLEKLKMLWTLTSKMAASICQNCKTLQILDLSATMGDLDSHLHIIENCQELKEVTLSLNPSLNTQSCNRRPLCSTFIFENVCVLYQFFFFF